MIKLVKNITSLALLLVFLISSCGFSISTHYCSGSKRTTHSIYTGFAGKQNSCGGMTCSIANKNAGSSSMGNIGKSACCKENTAFYKIAAVYNDLSLKSSFFSLSQNIIYQASQLQSYSIDRKQHDTFLPEQYIPPFLAGKQLVLFIRQIRIPAPSSIS